MRVDVQVMLVFVVGYTVCFSHASVYEACKNIQTQPDFDPTRYGGKWYDIEKTNFPGQMDKTCPLATYTLQDDGRIHVLNQDLSADGKKESTSGFAHYMDANDKSKLIVQLGDSPPANYWIVNTDYTSYSLVYSCNDIGVGNASIYWILAREHTLDTTVITKLKTELTTLGLEPGAFYHTVEDECPW